MKLLKLLKSALKAPNLEIASYRARPFQGSRVWQYSQHIGENHWLPEEVGQWDSAEVQGLNSDGEILFTCFDVPAKLWLSWSDAKDA